MITGLIGSAGIFVGIVVIVLLVFKAYKKSPPDQVMVVTGMGQEKYVIGNSCLVIPFLQRIDRLNLGVVQTVLSTAQPIPTFDALLIDVKAVANFQISTDPELLKVAARNYLNQDKETMERDVSEVLMGKMREVIGQMEIVNLMRNRDEFNAKVFEGAKEDMHALGLELTTFNVQDFTDHEDVIKNMGADQANQIRKDAQFSRIAADQEVAVRQNELDLKEAELKKTADKAKAEAEMVYETTTAERTRELNIAQQEAEIAAEEKRIELKERAVAVKERELEATVKKQAEADRYAAEQAAEASLYSEQKQAEAKLFTAQQEAKATKAYAEAEADKIRSIGKAEGDAEKAKGLGLAEATKEQINAYNEMANANFLADHYIGIMPEIAKSVAEPLTAVDNIVMYGTGNAASLVEETTKMTSQISNGLADSLGIDLKTIISSVVGGTAAGKAMNSSCVNVPNNILKTNKDINKDNIVEDNIKPKKQDNLKLTIEQDNWESAMPIKEDTENPSTEDEESLKNKIYDVLQECEESSREQAKGLVKDFLTEKGYKSFDDITVADAKKVFNKIKELRSDN